MSAVIDQILAEVERRVTPTIGERQRIEGVVKHLEQTAKVGAEQLGLEVDTLLAGSVARDTWLSGEADLDFFLLFPANYSRSRLESDGLNLAQRVAEGKGIKVYAEHPYLRTVYQGIRVDLVPAVKVENTAQKVTAVDRTPFHLRFFKERLTPRMCAEIRILKKYMKGVGVYGSEARTLGFSGFVCELLALAYGGFLNFVSAVDKWKPPTVVSLGQNQVKSSSHLIVVDPTDPTRNAAAAVTLDSYSLLVASCHRFLSAPSLKFFFPEEYAPKNVWEDALKVVHKLTVIEITMTGIVEEVAWSELRSSSAGIARHLTRKGFNVLDTYFCLNGGSGYLAFETDSYRLPETELRSGPPVYEH
ncbi:MAG: CCA tRNA nucleotidyltransferase, partial [Thermoprotei archaeon]